MLVEIDTKTFEVSGTSLLGAGKEHGHDRSARQANENEAIFSCVPTLGAAFERWL